MTVLNYIREQKRKLEERHLGETFLCLAGEDPLCVAQVKGCAGFDFTRSAQEILSEIDGLRGLNVSERERACAYYRRKKSGKTFA